MAGAADIHKPTGRAKSCVVCRQFKLACDARKTAPDPCSRCVSKNLKCRFDPNFKRIATRKIAQEVADELHTLRAAQNADSSSRGGSTPHSQMLVGGQSPAPTQEAPGASISSSGSLYQHNADPSQPQWLDLAENEFVSDQSIHSVSVSSSRILKLFYHFDRYYFPHTHFLPKLKSINELTTRCPLLFWTILVVSAERYEGSSDGLYEQLCGIHDILMADVLHKAIQQLEVVHALLILSLWPIPKLRNAYDPSWNYLALAISASSSLNCHRPLGRDEATTHYRGLTDTSAAEMEPPCQAMTWISCYQMGVRLSAYLGLPPPLSLPQQAQNLRRSEQVAGTAFTAPNRVSSRMLDVLCIAQTQLDTIEDHSSHFSMTQTLISQLDNIRLQSQEHWSWTLEVQMLAVKIYIIGITMTLDLPREEGQLSQALLYRQVMLETGMNAASSFVSTMTDLSNQSIPGHRYASGILTFYPKYIFTSLVASACFLFRFLISYQGSTSAQQSLAVSRIAEAHKILQSFPDHRDAIRGCIHIEHFVNAVKYNPDAGGPSMTELKVKNRLGASVVHDAIFRAALERNRTRTNGSGVPVSEWLTMNDDAQNRLPLAPEQKISSPPQSQSWSGNAMPVSGIEQQNTAAWVGLWDTYSDEFGVLNEPWVQADAEFSMSGIHAQSMFPPIPLAGDFGQTMIGG